MPATTLESKTLLETAEAFLVDHMKRIAGRHRWSAELKGKTGFEPDDLQHQFRFVGQLCRRLSDFEVVLGPGGEVAGYEDAEKWNGCEARSLADDELEEVLWTKSHLPLEGWGREGVTTGEKGELRVVLVKGESRREVCINPARKLVISVKPIDGMTSR